MIVNKIKKTLDNYLDNPSDYIDNEDFKNFVMNDVLGDKYSFKVSSGMGNPAVIPWWGIFNKKLTTGASKGYYIVFLYKANMDGCYLSLNFGATEFNEKIKPKGIKIEEAAQHFRNILKNKFPFNFKKMDLGVHPRGNKSSGQEDYENGNIFSIEYKKDDLPTNEQLINDLKFFLEMYDYLVLVRGNNILTDDEILKLKNGECIDYQMGNNKFLYSEFQRNKIFFGAPGTGKSHMLNKQKDELLKNLNNTNYERVTFHPDYAYANFVGTYKPIPDVDAETGKKIITYDFVEGPFLRILCRAIKNPNEPFLLIIEEINRANVAAVFGDIFQLLDRNDKYCSEFPIDISGDMKKFFKRNGITKKELPNWKLYIPDNMFIWATMNSADQGVFFMDTAFKRRWEFTHVDIDNEERKIEYKEFSSSKEYVNWNSLRKSINSFLLKEGINEDKLIGPFFISDIVKYNSEASDKKFIESFKNKILMYLWEDAAKSRKELIFEEFYKNSEDFSYSKLCNSFDKNGIYIFNSQITNNVEKKYIDGNDKKSSENDSSNN